MTTNFTITAQILARSLAFLSSMSGQTHEFIIYASEIDSGQFDSFWIHSYFDNVMTKFMINNRSEA